MSHSPLTSPSGAGKKPGPALSAFARFVATAGFAGYSPIAPGTCGTVVAVPIAWALAGTGLAIYLAATVVITIGGIVCADLADRSWGTHDSGRIVIDEVAGYLVTLVPLVPILREGSGLRALTVGFVVFRVLDIVKPPPVRQVDRHLGGGAGVVLDDVLAGVYGAALMWGLHHVHAV